MAGSSRPICIWCREYAVAVPPIDDGHKFVKLAVDI